MNHMNARLLVALAAGLASAPAIGGSVDFWPASVRENSPPRAYRKGRRSGYGYGITPKRGNPAGTKLAKKAAKGTLTICGIR